jgi:hypothetical protein
MTSIRFFSLRDFQSCTDYVLAQWPDQFLSSSPMPLFIFAAPVRLTRPSLLAFLEQPPPVTVFRFSICSPPGEGSCAGLSPPKFFFFWLSLLRELGTSRTLLAAVSGCSSPPQVSVLFPAACHRFSNLSYLLLCGCLQGEPWYDS